MTIIEAIKSGKAFRRKNRIVWLDTTVQPYWSFTVEDILADDWEVREE